MNLDLVASRLVDAGLTPTEKDVQLVAGAYALLGDGVDALYAVAEARYDEPAVTFRADAPLDVWR